jgi:hypothetical protein
MASCCVTGCWTLLDCSEAISLDPQSALYLPGGLHGSDLRSSAALPAALPGSTHLRTGKPIGSMCPSGDLLGYPGLSH